MRMHLAKSCYATNVRYQQHPNTFLQKEIKEIMFNIGYMKHYRIQNILSTTTTGQVKYIVNGNVSELC